MRSTQLVVTAVTALVIAAALAASASAHPARSTVQVSTYHLDFGDCPVGQSCYASGESSVLVVQNIGAVDLVMADQFAQFSGAFGPQEGDCVGTSPDPPRLAPGGVCAYLMSFGPLKRKAYTGRACFSFVAPRSATVCAVLTGRGI